MVFHITCISYSSLKCHEIDCRQANHCKKSTLCARNKKKKQKQAVHKKTHFLCIGTIMYNLSKDDIYIQVEYLLTMSKNTWHVFIMENKSLLSKEMVEEL